jgi:hypothetical protein
VNVASLPAEVPLAFVAMSRKWYVVPGCRTAMFAVTATCTVPEPASCTAVCSEYAVLVPYWNA